ncbi:MAG: inositol monophosphatase [Chloroflexi bacterium]|nr:inositol monophosphatase [Chloroflexota bacterium]
MKDTFTTVLGIARGAAAILREGYGRVEQVEYKGAVNLVTEWDRKSEAFIVESLRGAFPEYGIHAEEGGAEDHDSEYEWLIDPLDGTTNFAHAFPIFAVAIALMHRGKPILGVVVDPLREEYFTATAGGGAALNGRPIHVSPTKSLGVSLLTTGFPYDVRTHPQNNVAEFANFCVRAQAVRRAGSAALDLCWTASGRADGFWEFRLKPWDVAAGALIVLEAGGRVTDAQGGERYLTGQSIVASNGLIHDEMLRVLTEGAEAPLPGN